MEEFAAVAAAAAINPELRRLSTFTGDMSEYTYIK